MKKRILTLMMGLLATVLFANNDGELKVGDKAPDFKLKNVDGKMVSLADYESEKGLIVVFTCNSCPVAQAYENRIIELHKKYASQGFPVVAINPNDAKVSAGDSFSKMKDRAVEKGYPFNYLYDETQETAKEFGATRTPHVFLLDGKGVVKYIGAIDNNQQDADAATKKYLEDAIADVKAGKDVTVPTTKAIGCSIKWAMQ